MKQHHNFFKKLLALTLTLLIVCSPLVVFAEEDAEEPAEVYEGLRDGTADFYVLEEDAQDSEAVHTDALVDCIEYTNRPSSESGYRDITMVYEFRFRYPYEITLGKHWSNHTMNALYDRESEIVFSQTESEADYKTVTVPVNGEEQEIRYTYYSKTDSGYYGSKYSNNLDDFYYLGVITRYFKATVPEDHAGFVLMIAALDEFKRSLDWDEAIAHPDTWFIYFGTQEEDGAIVHDEKLDSLYRPSSGEQHFDKSTLQRWVERDAKEAAKREFAEKEAKLMPLLPVFAILPVLFVFLTYMPKWKKEKEHQDSLTVEYSAAQEIALEKAIAGAKDRADHLRKELDHNRIPEFKQKLHDLVSDPEFGKSHYNYSIDSEQAENRIHEIIKLEGIHRDKDGQPRNGVVPNFTPEGKEDPFYRSKQDQIMAKLHKAIIAEGLPVHFPAKSSLDIFLGALDHPGGARENIIKPLFPNYYTGRTNDDLTGIQHFRFLVNDAYRFSEEEYLQQACDAGRKDHYKHEVPRIPVIITGLIWCYILIVWLLSIYYHCGGTLLQDYPFNDSVVGYAMSVIFLIPQALSWLNGTLFWVFAAVGFAAVMGVGALLSGYLAECQGEKYYNKLLKKEIDINKKAYDQIRAIVDTVKPEAEAAIREITNLEDFKTAMAAEEDLHAEDEAFLARWLKAWEYSEEHK